MLFICALLVCPCRPVVRSLFCPAVICAIWFFVLFARYRGFYLLNMATAAAVAIPLLFSSHSTAYLGVTLSIHCPFFLYRGPCLRYSLGCSISSARSVSPLRDGCSFALGFLPPTLDYYSSPDPFASFSLPRSSLLSTFSAAFGFFLRFTRTAAHSATPPFFFFRFFSFLGLLSSVVVVVVYHFRLLCCVCFCSWSFVYFFLAPSPTRLPLQHPQFSHRVFLFRWLWLFVRFAV